MTEPRPLLSFAPPNVGPIPTAPRWVPRRPQRPSAARQGARLTPRFRALAESLEAERISLADEAGTTDPELVAVFDLAGSVDRFINAASIVPGLEFLAELRGEEVDADDDFYFEGQDGPTDDTVPQSLYMVMTNAEAVTELIRLFELWQEDQSITFERGLAPLKEVFGLLRDIRRWGPEDRIRETGLLEQWNGDVAVAQSQGRARVEIELWYQADPSARAAADHEVSSVVANAGGQVIARADLAHIAYHTILADLPYAEVAAVLANGPSSIDLLKTESVMLVGPSRSMTFTAPEPQAEVDQTSLDQSLPSQPPRVALLDGVPLANHTSLADRVLIDDPDSLGSAYSARQQSHGTAMASLLIHGDLSNPGPTPDSKLYIRPILIPHPVLPGVETFPPDKLMVDVIDRAFHRMFEGDANHAPAAPSVRVVNLSIGDPARVFVRRLSPLARLLDWLAHKYNVVVVVSAGNHELASPVINIDDIDDITTTQAIAAQSVHAQIGHRGLLSPAEGVNVLTVGALHSDGSMIDLPDTVIDVIPDGSPAIYSAAGFGFRRSVKPEVLLPGGRQVFLRPTQGASGEVRLDPARTTGTGPGIVVASPGAAGELNASVFSVGTSNAAALASRAVNRILSTLDNTVPGDSEPSFPAAQYHPVLAKTLLVHAAGWGDITNEIANLLGLPGREVRPQLTRLLGYGPCDQQRIAAAERVRAVLVGAGSIEKDSRHTFRFPLPASLAATTDWRRLTLTLGWLSPLNMRSQKYRMARLRFAAPRDELGVAPVDADHNRIHNGTIQHQVLEGTAAVAFTDGDSLTINIDCRIDAGSVNHPIRYAIAASLEVAPTLQVDIQDEVRMALRSQVREQTRAQVRSSG